MESHWRETLADENIVGGAEKSTCTCGVALQANKSDASRGEWRRTMLEETNDGGGN